MRYVVESRGGGPVGICPFIVTRSKSIYWFYSLDKFYFSSWQDQLLQLDPMRAEQIAHRGGLPCLRSRHLPEFQREATKAYSC